MKRLMIFIGAMAMTMFVFATANAVVDVDTIGSPGAIVNMTINLTGADDLEFKPSPQVMMSVYSTAFGFSTNGVHAAAITTDGGQAYGMANDTTKVYWVSVAADDAALVAVSTASSAEFEVTQTDYNPMQ